MPNHFHLLIVPNKHAGVTAKAVKPSVFQGNYVHQEKLSQAIGSLLSSYTQAVNKKYKRSGSLFRANTKVKDGWIDDVISVDGKNKELFFRPDNDYALQCFRYIHKNPVEANLVKKSTDWIYSSAQDYAGMRNGTLCNMSLALEILGVG